MPILSKGAFKKIEIYASKDATEQEEIVEILDVIDQKIDLHKRKKAVLEELFKSLLHKLMTGEVRVTDLDLSALLSDGFVCSDKISSGAFLFRTHVA